MILHKHTKLKRVEPDYRRTSILNFNGNFKKLFSYRLVGFIYGEIIFIVKFRILRLLSPCFREFNGSVYNYVVLSLWNATMVTAIRINLTETTFSKTNKLNPFMEKNSCLISKWQLSYNFKLLYISSFLKIVENKKMRCDLCIKALYLHKKLISCYNFLKINFWVWIHWRTAILQ